MKRMVTIQRGFADLLFGLVALCLPASAKASDPTPATSSFRAAALAMKTSHGDFKIGGPVLVSRQHIESPLARMGVGSLNEPPHAAKGPDPIYNAVYLTPRENTGRPGLPAPSPARVEEPPQIAATEKPAVFGLTAHQPGAVPAEPTPKLAPPERKTAALNPPQSGPQDHHPAAKRPPASAPPRPQAQKPVSRPTAAPPKTAQAPAGGKFGPAEIGATRAFSRM